MEMEKVGLMSKRSCAMNTTKLFSAFWVFCTRVETTLILYKKSQEVRSA